MPEYPVYLEIADGTCLAHVLDLPGCVVRSSSREEALAQVPDAIRDYHAWLRRHREPAPVEDSPIEIRITGQVIGVGPFDPGDPAALFGPDRDPITDDEMERYFRLMEHSRADLLDLVSELPEDVMDWQVDPQSFSIRQALRHIGNAEEWYVSRIVDPETLPAEWEDDAELSTFEFLEMERLTAVGRLQQLTEEERSKIFYPRQWTDYPGEPWTVRKMLRRFLEHEREHMAHIREILVAQRTHLLARLDTERVRLLKQVAGLDENTLTTVPAFDGWTVKDVLAHIAAWDRWALRTMKRMSAGNTPDLAAVEDLDTFNANVVAAWRHRTLDEVRQELEEAREALVAWLRTIPEEEIFQQRVLDGSDWSFPGLLQVQWEHDAEHTAQIAAWRADRGLGEEKGAA